MSERRVAYVGFALCVCLFVAGFAWASGGKQRVSVAPSTSVGYRATNVASYRTGLSGADAAEVTSTTVTALDKVECEGFQSLTVHGRFSVASATAVCLVVRYNGDDTLISVEEFTLTAKATFTVSGDYMSNPNPVDTEGAEYVRVIIAAPSSGTVDLWIGAF